MENYKGAIWATWDPAAPSFLDYIGGYRLYLDLLLDAWDGREGGTEVIGGVHKWLHPLQLEVPGRELLRRPLSRREPPLGGHGRDRPQRQGAPRHPGAERVALARRDVPGPRPLDDRVPPAARAAIAPAYQEAPVVADYFRHCEEERRRRRGEQWRLFGGPGTVFPNTSPLARQPRTIAVWHPRGPHRTEAWRWYLVDADAPAEVKDFLRQYYIRYSGPAGLTEQDDMENWNYAHAASRGAVARRYPYNYEMGLGRATEAFEDHGLRLPGQISDVTQAKASEQNQRGFYRRWRQFMEAESWGALAPR